jgi:hypothetical protein
VPVRRYLAEIGNEAERAAALYDLLIPGLELTYDALDARRGAHAVAVGTAAIRRQRRLPSSRALRNVPRR